ncbi:MAG: vanillate O-demethylase oxidoreductase VanB [Gemmatimonadetes bacterium]|nr:vanillate O-demethylase oxidoreductase VanB [Gemmatimonadota bacterium]
MTDTIRKEAVLKAPRARVWRAISDAAEFRTWFKMELDGPISAGSTRRAKVLHPGYEHCMFDISFLRVEPEHHVSWRWHPNAVDMSQDYSTEPTTLVTFDLEDAEGGTKLTIVESGFDALPDSRRDIAFRGNEGGWTGQMKNIIAHVERDA